MPLFFLLSLKRPYNHEEEAVVASVIIHNNKVLCIQRGDNKHDYIAFTYEFSGGKIEIGKTNETALVRTIQEELNLKIKIKAESVTVNF